ncbi:MAG TPA: hypothetical protein VE819_12495 [Steroidobacteraceae bacterium]|nr:hypothetical protein [Steroidobacteraceae bacterium]
MKKATATSQGKSGLGRSAGVGAGSALIMRSGRALRAQRVGGCASAALGRKAHGARRAAVGPAA